MSENHDHHNSGGLTAFLGSMVFVFAFFFYLVFINKGPNLDEKIAIPDAPGTVKFNLAAAKDPWVATPEIITAGQKLYKQNCALCHGEKGDLVGGIPNARNLVIGEWKMGKGIINHYKVLQTGIPGTQMASFKQSLAPFERWAILNYVDTLTNNKSTDAAADVAQFASTAD